METVITLISITTIAGGAWILGVWCGRKIERGNTDES